MMGNNSLSVALCTYNGSQYLPDQLHSIAQQTRLPDELIIADDRSTDDTLKIIDDFKRSAGFPVHININHKNLGVTPNFEQAISLCTGDIIVLSDQDDWWHPEKLRHILAEFSKSPKVGLVFSNAEMVDESLRPLGYCLWERVGFHSDKQLQAIKGNLFSLLLKENYVTGATMAFRSHFRRAILPIPLNFVHDAWIAVIISAMADVVLIPDPLIKYRLHAGNQIGVMTLGFAGRWRRALKADENTYVTQAEGYSRVLERLAVMRDAPKIAHRINEVQGKLNHLHQRAKMRQEPMARFVLAFKELVHLRYHHYSSGWASFAKDVFL
jgi:glycosyltransferase involved in cell wall biosynthesis